MEEHLNLKNKWSTTAFLKKHNFLEFLKPLFYPLATEVSFGYKLPMGISWHNTIYDHFEKNTMQLLRLMHM